MFLLRRALGAGTLLKQADTLDHATLQRVDALLSLDRPRKGSVLRKIPSIDTDGADPSDLM